MTTSCWPLRFLTAAFTALLLMGAPLSHADAPPSARAEVASLRYSRSQAAGLESALTRPGTEVRILLTHGESDWRALDTESSHLTALVDGKGVNLAVTDANDIGAVPAGIQPADSFVSPDGQKAVVTVWGGGIPSNGVDEITVRGSAAVFCGPAETINVDREGIRVAGGETFNVQPFRVVTSRGDGRMEFELRCLKSAAFIREVSISTPAGKLASVGAGNQVSSGQEWLWRGDFLLPLRADKVNLTVSYLPIARVDQVPFDLTVGLAFGTPPSNSVMRWLKKKFF